MIEDRFLYVINLWSIVFEKSGLWNFFNRICSMVAHTVIMFNETNIFPKYLYISVDCQCFIHYKEESNRVCFFYSSLFMIYWHCHTCCLCFRCTAMEYFTHTKGNIIWYSVPTSLILSQICICHETMAIISDTAKSQAVAWSITNITKIIIYNYIVFSIKFYFTYTVYTFEILFSWPLLCVLIFLIRFCLKFEQEIAVFVVYGNWW
jgi:hypothetical protein